MNTYEVYDAGEIDVTTTAKQITLSKKEARSILIYPKMDCYVAFNGSDKEIFIPANSWTPISVNISNFAVRASTDSGKVYWQAWYV